MNVNTRKEVFKSNIQSKLLTNILLVYIVFIIIFMIPIGLNQLFSSTQYIQLMGITVEIGSTQSILLALSLAVIVSTTISVYYLSYYGLDYKVGDKLVTSYCTHDMRDNINTANVDWQDEDSITNKLESLKDIAIKDMDEDGKDIIVRAISLNIVKTSSIAYKGELEEVAHLSTTEELKKAVYSFSKPFSFDKDRIKRNLNTAVAKLAVKPSQLHTYSKKSKSK